MIPKIGKIGYNEGNSSMDGAFRSLIAPGGSIMRPRENLRLSVLAALLICLVAAGPALAVKTYTFKKADNLWDLMMRYYGEPRLFPAFCEVNGVDNPRTVLDGKVLVIPSIDELKKIAQEKNPTKRRELIDKATGAKSGWGWFSSGSTAEKKKTPPPLPVRSIEKILEGPASKTLKILP